MAKKTFYKQEHSEIKSGFFRGWSKAEFGVWLSLRAHENINGYCYPSYDLIRLYTGLHRHSIAEALRSLEKRKAITIERKNGKVNRYFIHAERAKTSLESELLPV